MVASMANVGHAKEVEDGNGDIPPSDLKGNEVENELSSPESTESSCQSSDEEDEDEEHVQEAEADTNAEPGAEAKTGEDMKQHCEKCEVLQRPSYEVVTPRKISRDRMLLFLEDEGVFECGQTGLVFEVTGKAQIRYRVLSWSRFGNYLSPSWTLAGPIFDVDCQPDVLKSIQFPHSLCLADQDSEMKFSVLHVKNNQGVIEPSADHSRSHVRWSVSSLSPVGPVVQATKPTEHHGVVLVFKEVGQQDSYSFRVYLASNNHSDIKDIQKEVRNSKKRYVKMEKPPTCQRLLGENRKYRLLSDPQGDITPEETQFTLDVVKMKGYFEVFFEQRPPFKLSLVEAESEETVWSATIREGTGYCTGWCCDVVDVGQYQSVL